MNNFIRNTNRIRIFIIILAVLIVGLFAADLIYTHQYNAKIHTSAVNEDNGEPYLVINNRDDSTGEWVKADFDYYGEIVDLKAQTFDGTLVNPKSYEVGDWYFTINIRGDCLLNNAWCGTMEIHQHVGTADEKVQTLDLRDYDLDSITLDYLYNGDLLIPLSAGDYVVYHPSAEDDEVPLDADTDLGIGFILYYLEWPDLSDITLTYQYNRSCTSCPLFSVIVILSACWLLLLCIFLISRIAYRAAKQELESKKSGISAMSDIYSIIYIIDLKTNELIPVVADKESERLRPKELNAQQQLQNLFRWDANEVYVDAVLDFCDLATIRERIGSGNTIVCEYVSRIHGWCRLRFFVMDRDSRSEPDRLIFAIRVINDEKKQLESLNEEVRLKTENIAEIQQKVVVGLANIIENRDNNTGGHVRRTSDIVSILVDEIERNGTIPIDPVLARDIVRAAPMHDLGKISIDSSILCKPGKLTAEEFEIMKTHSTISGEMVRLLLEGVEEGRFVNTAFHIARYHHERWDGRGYPEGLKGEEIPLEARIMAIADVYDALVSKRCYKEPMSFEQAYNIMLEGMGTQFAPEMRDIFLGCHEKLEEYYRQNA